MSVRAESYKKWRVRIYFGVKNNSDAIDSTVRDSSRKISESMICMIYPGIYEIAENQGIIDVFAFNGNDRPYSVNGKFYIRSLDEDRQIGY